MSKKIDLHPLVWIWPLTLVVAIPFIFLAIFIYFWLRIGTWIIEHTIGNRSPLIDWTHE